MAVSQQAQGALRTPPLRLNNFLLMKCWQNGVAVTQRQLYQFNFILSGSAYWHFCH